MLAHLVRLLQGRCAPSDGGKGRKGRRAVSIDSALGMQGDDNLGFAGVSEAHADRDSIRGHNDRFVYWREQLALHSTCN
jgi:hypothetical protein